MMFPGMGPSGPKTEWRDLPMVILTFPGTWFLLVLAILNFFAG